MSIKFPQTITEYTNGELWYDGVEDSIARRILFSLKDVKDSEEMSLRKKYLAHYYCERGDFKLAINLCRQLLLEEGIDKEVLLLMQFCCVRVADINGLGEVLNAVKELSPDDKDEFFENFEHSDFADVMMESEERPNGVKVEFKDGWVEYYKKGKLIFKLFDNDYDAFTKDNSARHALHDGDPIQAVAKLDSIKFKRLKQTTSLLCEQTYVIAFSELGEYLKAYEHCKAFFKHNIYIDAMLMLLIALKEEGRTEEAQELRAYICSLDRYDVGQLKVFYDYSEEYNDYEFWRELEKNNPLAELPENDERLCLEGRALGRRGDLEDANKCWLKARSIYGHFSCSNYYLTYPDIFAQATNLAKSAGLSSEDVDAKTLSDLCRDVVSFELYRISDLTKKDVLNDAVLRMLNVALVNFVINLDTIVPAIFKIYNTGLTPLVSEINRLALCEDASEINRAICLANFMMGSKSKYFFFNGEFHKNIAIELKGGCEEIKYAICAFYANVIIRHINLKYENRIRIEVKKIYAMLDWAKYPKLQAYALYCFLLDLFANARPSLVRMPNYYSDIDVLREIIRDNECLVESAKYGKTYQKIIAKLVSILDR